LLCGVRDEQEEELDHELLEVIKNWGVNDIVNTWGGFAAQMSEQLLLLQREQETAAAAAAAAAGSSSRKQAASAAAAAAAVGDVHIKQEPTDGNEGEAVAAVVLNNVRGNADGSTAAAQQQQQQQYNSSSSSSSAVERQLEELVRQHLVRCKAVAALNPGVAYHSSQV
jgi:hypothetical protein